MSLKVYTIHVKPSTRPDAMFDPDAIFVPEGFSFIAMVFQGTWAMYHQLWLVTFLMFLISTVIQILSTVVTGSATLGVVLNLAFAVLIGAEARNLWRWTLTRHGYRQTGVVMGETQEDAERRYFEQAVAEDEPVLAGAYMSSEIEP